MVTTKDIESLGWEHYGTMSDGGSKVFSRPNMSVNGRYIRITNHADNFIYEKNDPDKLVEIEIDEVLMKDGKVQAPKRIWKGMPFDVNHFKAILIELKIEL